jgi:hypothetical protein
MYITTCPACNEDDCLYVISGVFQTVGMNLHSDGFAFDDAQQVSTEDETVMCGMCDRLFSLGNLYREDGPDKKMKLRGK